MIFLFIQQLGEASENTIDVIGRTLINLIVRISSISILLMLDFNLAVLNRGISPAIAHMRHAVTALISGEPVRDSGDLY